MLFKHDFAWLLAVRGIPKHSTNTKSALNSLLELAKLKMHSNSNLKRKNFDVNPKICAVFFTLIFRAAHRGWEGVLGHFAPGSSLKGEDISNRAVTVFFRRAV